MFFTDKKAVPHLLALISFTLRIFYTSFFNLSLSLALHRSPNIVSYSACVSRLLSIYLNSDLLLNHLNPRFIFIGFASFIFRSPTRLFLARPGRPSTLVLRLSGVLYVYLGALHYSGFVSKRRRLSYSDWTPTPTFEK